VVWIPEISLGLGCERRVYGNWDREWLYWYDRNNVRYPTAEESAEQERMVASQERMIAQQERQQKLQERQQKEKLANYLRSLGIDPDQI